MSPIGNTLSSSIILKQKLIFILDIWFHDLTTSHKIEILQDTCGLTNKGIFKPFIFLVTPHPRSNTGKAKLVDTLAVESGVQCPPLVTP